MLPQGQAPAFITQKKQIQTGVDTVYPVQERVILSNLKDPVLLAAFATPSKGGSTGASTLSYLTSQWDAEPVLEFGAEGYYDYSRIRPQLQHSDGQATLQWPSNTVYIANPPELDRSVLILVGVEPNLGWPSFLATIDSFCRRNGVSRVLTLHSAPAGVSHRYSTPVVAVYGDETMKDAVGLPATTYQDGPMDFSAVLSLHLQAAGFQTADLIALEPFYTPGLPDAQAALALVRAIDRFLGCRIPVESLTETARDQREMYDRAVVGSEQLSALAASLEEQQLQIGSGITTSEGENLRVEEVMDEVAQILSLR